MNPSMKRALTAFAAALWLVPAAVSASDDPASVLILANVQTVAEEGTRGKRAGVWVAERYAEARGVPKGNIVRLSVPLACCRNSPAAWDSFNISFARYQELIERPVLEHMEKKGITNRIRYIVPTYGIPTRIYDVANGASVDSFLAGMAYGNDSPRMLNPYRGAVERLQPRFADWVDPTVPRPYLVTPARRAERARRRRSRRQSPARREGVERRQRRRLLRLSRGLRSQRPRRECAGRRIGRESA